MIRSDEINEYFLERQLSFLELHKEKINQNGLEALKRKIDRWKEWNQPAKKVQLLLSKRKQKELQDLTSEIALTLSNFHADIYSWYSYKCWKWDQFINDPIDKNWKNPIMPMLSEFDWDKSIEISRTLIYRYDKLERGKMKVERIVEEHQKKIQEIEQKIEENVKKLSQLASSKLQREVTPEEILNSARWDTSTDAPEAHIYRSEIQETIAANASSVEMTTKDISEMLEQYDPTESSDENKQR